jgi:hypothetical protein
MARPRGLASRRVRQGGCKVAPHRMGPASVARAPQTVAEAPCNDHPWSRSCYQDMVPEFLYFKRLWNAAAPGPYSGRPSSTIT